MIEARKLTKTYGGHVAVDALDLNIERGTICAFLGPNGAGKSTAVKMLTGLLTPTSGQATVAGIACSPATPALSRAVGVLPESLGLFDSLTVEEHLTLTGSVYGLRAAETERRTTELLSALALEDGRQTFLDECSYGMRKKTALAMALFSKSTTELATRIGMTSSEGAPPTGTPRGSPSIAAPARMPSVPVPGPRLVKMPEV